MKTKILNYIISAIFLFIGISSHASDYTFRSFKYVGDYVAEITGLEPETYQGCVEIPKTIFDGVPYKVTRIFLSDCKYVTEFIIPKSVTHIVSFEGCSGMTSIKIPFSVTTISFNAFKGCTGLTSITIPYSVTNLYNIGGDNLTEILVDIDNEHYTSVNGVVYTKDMTKIIQYPQKHPEKNFIIPNSVTNIDLDAFMGCSELKSITIPNSVTKIEYNAFHNCSGLTSITLPNSVTEIGGGAFYGCSALRSITIPNSITKIEYETFYDCSALYSITIPNSVTEIGHSAFKGCSALKSITIPNSVATIGYEAFLECKNLESIYMLSNTPPVLRSEVANSDVFKNATLYVPIGCKRAYEKDLYWSDFLNIEEMDFSGIDDIHENTNIPITVENGSIIIDDKNKCEVKIYSTNGRLVYNGTNGRIDNLQHGIYIIHVGDKVTKVAI